MTIESESDLIAGLTPRQREVIELIDRRVPIKLIANELGISPSRVNQHIRALKDRFEAESLAELVEAYRAHRSAHAHEADYHDADNDASDGGDDGRASDRAASDGVGAPPSPQTGASRRSRSGALSYGAVVLIVVALALGAALFIVGPG